MCVLNTVSTKGIRLLGFYWRLNASVVFISMTMLRLAMNCASSLVKETFEGVVADKKTLQFTLQVKKKITEQ